MKKQNGFTLIELVVVIIILGILAVTAAPKFLNFQSDALKSTVSGLEGALKSADSLVYSKSVIAGNDGTAKSSTNGPEVTLPGNKKVALNYGHPTPVWSGSLENALDINAAASGTTTDWLFKVVASENAIYFYPQGQKDPKASSDAGKCFVKYTNGLSAKGSASVTKDVSACL
ncbi:pilus assembly FimT family protein [Parashewanella tropica]|uniref:pilus assembly FimT family protein n=1 Tax=Parashewanella tropica TaxID=2547970 RepID=UPI001059E776|nr:prepilin-type N-terminal cleavage/methylation domain-containing protein [Parashewanella tropica]